MNYFHEKNLFGDYGKKALFDNFEYNLHKAEINTDFFQIELDLDEKIENKVARAFIHSSFVKKMSMNIFYQNIRGYMFSVEELQKKITKINDNLKDKDIPLELSVDCEDFMMYMYYVKIHYERVNSVVSRNINNKLIKSMLGQYVDVPNSPIINVKEVLSIKNLEMKGNIFRIKKVKENLVFKDYLPNILINPTEPDIRLTSHLLKEYQNALASLWIPRGMRLYYTNSKQDIYEHNKKEDSFLRELCLKGKLHQIDSTSADKVSKIKNKI